MVDGFVKSSQHSPGCAYAEFIRRMPDALRPSGLRRGRLLAACAKVGLIPQALRALSLALFTKPFRIRLFTGILYWYHEINI